MPEFGQDGRNISRLARARSSTLFWVEKGQNMLTFDRDDRYIPNFGQDGQNIPIFDLEE